MFEGFDTRRIDTGTVSIHTWVGGDGPPLLLLHGYPQTHVMWHAVLPRLVDRFTVVLTDLRGYGDSDKPAGDPDHAAYSKRAMAADQARVMTALGFDRFMVAGHDRGGRVTHRLCLDHADRIERAAVLDIVPTRTMFDDVNRASALGYYHWYFLAQPAPFPETLIGADPDFFLDTKLGAWSANAAPFAEEALAEYRRCFRDPATIHASCEDYRAAATIDLDHDTADQDARIQCPLLVLWGAGGLIARWYDVCATWRDKAVDVRGQAIEAGHFLCEENPDATAAALLAFFGSDGA